ncbi:uncharacterized protein A4U43_C01F23140 [Asparagus officinalis]|uniref:Bacterial surface antigen (D15) domain-containing protein n=1 Tax=Asparagus officinalis TaxID=4686 RepID=A0A5P1FS32_ASPOF|nr:uncharacterized protein A4U43_C01F23140 [Asparagus officinalis]
MKGEEVAIKVILKAKASIQPGGTVTFEHRNIKGQNRSIVGSVTSSNLLNPQDDLSFKLEYVHPYLDGVYNPRNRTFRTSCFNSRKMSPVFTGGPGVDEVPPVWIDRVGLKANITESFTRQSKFTYGLVMEEITTRDETSTVCTNGARQLPTGALSMDGPPTTLSGTGVDRMAFAQANITRDNTKFVNSAIVGERNVFQLDQGLGIGTNFPFFNHRQLTLTRFTLGGPNSVRGYNMGGSFVKNVKRLALAAIAYSVYMHYGHCGMRWLDEVGTKFVVTRDMM